MLDANELRRRLIDAMDLAQPKVSSAAMASACHVTAQAVNGWRKTGRIAKRHLATIARLTGKPLEYFLSAERGVIASHGLTLGIEEADAVKRLRDGDPHWRRYVLGLAMVERSQQELLLLTMRQAVPDYRVEAALKSSPVGYPPGQPLATVRESEQAPGKPDKKRKYSK